MLNFSDITAAYPKSLQGFKRNMLREYLQYKILAVLFNSPFGSKLSFIGGTALRIVYNNQRFSEDIDLDNFNLTITDFDNLAGIVQKKLEAEGFKVEIRMVHKGAFRCYIKFPDLLFKLGLTPIEEEKVLIQVDTAPHHFNYSPDVIILNKFDIFTPVRVTPIDILLAQKFFCARDRKNPKGRDFYDITFLAAKTKPNYQYLTDKMKIGTPNELKLAFGAYIAKLDFEALAKDVQPFLFNPEDAERVRLFPTFFAQSEF